MFMMTAFRQENQKLFPLKSISDVVNLFRHHLEGDNEPNLTLLSIVSGILENTLTSSRTAESSSQQAAPPVTKLEVFSNFPVVSFESVEPLYKKFINVLSSSDIKQNKVAKNYATRNIIKKISDIIWNSLARSSYKDRAHLQSLYSYLTGNKLDCFGVAFAVVAGCQMLGYSDAHLAMSEDHVWIMFGESGDETIEVTWHGKGSEDKRGLPVSCGIESQSWLYLSGNPVVCDRYMEVAALVSAINPTLNMSSTCQEVEDLQKQLLWLLYDLGHLKRYPMALGTLGELEEASPTSGRKTCEQLFEEAVESAKKIYKNHHVYPYTFQGCYYSRTKNYRKAFTAWANAGDVIRLYNYSRDDEEIYKEFLEIANDTIPQIMKLESSGHSAKSILRDSECFANLLRFYDGICQWEEGSLTPILHIGWAKPLVSTIGKFDYDIRSQVIINSADNDDENHSNHHRNIEDHNISIKSNAKKLDNKLDKINNNNNNNNNNNININNNNNFEKDDSLIMKLKALTEACGEKILNPDFLLQGGGQPFTTDSKAITPSTVTDELASVILTSKNIKKESVHVGGVMVVGGGDLIKSETDKKKSDDNKITIMGAEKLPATTTVVVDDTKKSCDEKIDENIEVGPKRPVIILYSQKMKGLKNLLLAERLNTQAISLQVTAQSQVQVGGKKNRFHFTGGYGLSPNDFETCTRPKRQRRE